MDLSYLHKALIGAIGMSVGAGFVTSLHVAALEAVLAERAKHVEEVASGKTPLPRVVLRGDLKRGDVPRAN